MKRVVITGMAAFTPIGNDWEEVKGNLETGWTGVVRMDEWDRYQNLRTRLAAPVKDFSPPASYNRKTTRSMGRVALMATCATERALQDARLFQDPRVCSGDMGIAYGSSSGSPSAIGDFGRMLLHDNTDGLNANSYIKMMGHTTAVNIGVHFGIRGRIITTSSACTSSSQGIGYAYETIRHGLQKLMVAGGADELHAMQAAVFDKLFSTSTRNDQPASTPRPFDLHRDGLVVGEGAATLVLEELEHARARGATIHAEIVGYHTNCDGTHVTQPNSESMRVVMERALEAAGLPASEIGYISAHGTATDAGDLAEADASHRVYGGKTPISALKSYTGHTLGACGAIEAWAAVHMMNCNWYAPSHNLETIDPGCARLDHIVGEGRVLDNRFVVSNNFAFGGINTSLIFKRW